MLASLHTIVIMLAKHPDVLKKAQEEVDRVVGPDRMPTLTDMPNLPYVNAVIEEVSVSLNTPLFDFSNACVVRPYPSDSTSQSSSRDATR